MSSLWLEQGERAFAEGRFEAAREALCHGLAEANLPPREAAAHYGSLAEANRELAAFQAAVDSCDRGLDILGDADDVLIERVRLLRLRGQALVDDGRAAEAEASLLEALQQAPSESVLERALVTRTLGEVRALQARYAESDALYIQAVDAISALLPDEHPELAEALNNCGTGAMRLGRLKEAEARFESALDTRRRGLPPMHPSIGLSLHNLSTLMLRLGRLDRAEALAQEALSLWENTLGPHHPRLALSCNNLGGIAERRGTYEEAEAYFRRGLEVRERALGHDHPSLILSINNVASAAQWLGRLEEADALFRRSLALAESVYGVDHPEVARALNNLQSVLTDLNRHEEGEELLLRAISIWERSLGPNSTELAVSLSNLALRQQARGDVDAAEASLLRALSIEERRLGVEHPDLATGVNNLGNLYLGMGRFEAAEQLYQRALDLRSRAGYRPLTSTLLNLAAAARRRGDSAQERDYLVQLVDVLETSVGPAGAELPRAFRELSRALRRLGEREAAVDALRRAMAVHEQSPPRDPNELVLTLTALGGALAADGQIPAAEAAYLDGIKRLDVDPLEHPVSLAELLILLGSLLARNGRASEAVPLLERAESLVNDSLGPDHTLAASAILWRGVSALNLGDHREAEELLLAALRHDSEVIGGGRTTIALHALRALYTQQGRHAEHAQVLEDLIGRAESRASDDERITGVLRELADLRLAASRHDEAARLYRRVLAASPYAEPGFRAATTYYLAICRWNLGDIEGAHDEFGAALALFRLTDDLVSRANCLTAWIDCFLLSGRQQDGLALADELESVADDASLPPDASSAAYHALGALFGACRRWDEARAAVGAALDLWTRADTPNSRGGVVAARHHLARLDHGAGEFVSAEKVYLELIPQLADEGADAEQGLAVVLNDYASLLDQMGRSSEAADVRSRAESLTHQQNQGSDPA